MKITNCVKYKIDEETYTLLPLGNTCSKRYVMIDDISYQVYCLLADDNTLDETVAEMLQRYDVTEDEFRSDLKLILRKWVEYGIVSDEQGLTVEVNEADEGDGNRESELTDIEIYDMMYQAAIKRNEPFKVYFEITHNCNFRCQHCYIQEKVRMQENVFLDKQIIIKTIDELKRLGTHEIVITGGECTLHKDFLEIIQYICNQGFKLVILTNGNLITDTFVQIIKNIPIADIRISIYGKQKMHDEMTCVNGSFQKSLNALKMLRKEKGIGTATILVTKDNYEELDELAGMFKENEIEYDFNAFIFPTTEQNMSPTNYRIENVINEFVEKYVINCSGSKCAAGISRFRVDPHGNVSPCDLLKHEKLGNLYDKSIEDIINSEERTQWLNKLNYIINHNACSKCEDKTFCSCCLGLIYMEHHDYSQKLNYLCGFTAAKKRKYQQIMGCTDV